jgi:WD40 repeat protein
MASCRIALGAASFATLCLAVLLCGCREQEAEKNAPTETAVVSEGPTARPQERAQAKVDSKGDGGKGGLTDKDNRRGRKPPGRTSLSAKCAAFSPDNKRAAIGFTVDPGDPSYDGPRLKIFDVQTLKEVGYWPGPRWTGKGGEIPIYERKYHNVFFVAYLPGGKEILTLERDNFCRIWQADEGKLVREFEIEAWLYEAKVEPMIAFGGSLTADGRQLLTISPGGFAVWDVAKGKALKHILSPGFMPQAFAISPDGKRALFRFNRTGAINDTTFSAYWDLENDKLVQHLKVDPKTRKDEQDTVLIPIAFSAAGRAVVVSKEKDRKAALVLCDSADLKEIKTLAPMSSMPPVVRGISLDGRRLLLAHYTGEIDLERLFNTKRFEKMECRLLPDSKTLWEDAWQDAQHRELAVNPLLAFSPDGTLALFKSGQTLFDAQKGKVLGRLKDYDRGFYRPR